MSILSMLKKGGKPPIETLVAPTPTAIAPIESVELNFQTALDSHTEWLGNLRKAVNNQEPFTADGANGIHPFLVGKCDKCVLGIWLHSEGKKKYGELFIFKELIFVHARFHRLAGLVLQMALEGKTIEANFEIDDGELAIMSCQIRELLNKLWSHYANC
jgi:methyl-accepting chemotaxis protein